jgi:HEAT repeat protein
MKPNLILGLAAGLILVLGPGSAARAGTADARDRIDQIKAEALTGRTPERVKAIEQLGRITDEGRLTLFKVPEFLLDILGERLNNADVRGAAADSLAKIFRFVPDSTQGIVGSLVKHLQDGKEEPAVRRKIAEVMAVFLDPEAVTHRTAFQELSRIVKNRNVNRPLLVAEALRALGKTGWVAALGEVVAAVRSEDEQVRRAAIEALQRLLSGGGKIMDKRTLVNQLVAIVTDDKVPFEIRKEAMKALVTTIRAGVDVQEVAATLTRVLATACEKKEAELAAAVIEVLYLVPEKSTVDALRRAYQDFKDVKEGGTVCVEVAVTLSDLFHPLAVNNQTALGQEVGTLLLQMSQNMDARVAQAAVKGLGMMTNEKYNRVGVVNELIKTMEKDKSAAVRAEAYNSLVKITQADLGDRDPKRWREWFEKNKHLLGPR